MSIMSEYGKDDHLWADSGCIADICGGCKNAAAILEISVTWLSDMQNGIYRVCFKCYFDAERARKEAYLE